MKERSIDILFAGDFIPPNTNSKVYSEDLLSVLNDKDFSIVNLEAPLTECQRAVKKNGNNFKVNPEAIKNINAGFFDAVSLSNNHISDFGEEGVIDTLQICKKNIIKTVGAGRNIKEANKPLRIEIKDKKIAFLNYSEREFNVATDNQAGANPYDTISAYYDILKEKQENDYVIVIYHGGIEYQYYPTQEIVRIFKLLIDFGADCIISHHTHRYSGTIIYQDRPIIFGLGNFLASTISKVTKEWQTGLVTLIKLYDKSIDFEIIPIRMSDNFNNVKLLSGSEKLGVLNSINSISDIIENKELLSNYWLNENKSSEERIIRIIKSNSRFEYRLRKYGPKLIIPRITDYKRLNLLNMVQCDSHREQLIQILSNKQNKKKKQ